MLELRMDEENKVKQTMNMEVRVLGKRILSKNEVDGQHQA